MSLLTLRIFETFKMQEKRVITRIQQDEQRPRPSSYCSSCSPHLLCSSNVGLLLLLDPMAKLVPTSGYLRVLFPPLQNSFLDIPIVLPSHLSIAASERPSLLIQSKIALSGTFLFLYLSIVCLTMTVSSVSVGPLPSYCLYITVLVVPSRLYLFIPGHPILQWII